MAKSKDGPRKDRATQVERLASQVRQLYKAVLALLCLCLGVSLALNVYLSSTQRAMQTRVREVERQLDSEGRLWRLYQRLIVDLRALSRTDEAVEALLKKYRIPLKPGDEATPPPPPEERWE